jgi:transposase-like protein
LGPYRSVVIKQPAAVIERRFVIVEPRKYEAEECELLKRIRKKKSEWFKKIKDGNKEQRRQAIENLAGFSFDPPVRAVLKKVLLSDPEPEVRRQAAKALGRVNNWKALPALKKAQAEDSNEEVRKEAGKAVKKVKEKFLKKLKEAEKLFDELKNKK